MQNPRPVLSLEALEDRLLLSVFRVPLGAPETGTRFSAPAQATETFGPPVGGFGTVFTGTPSGLNVPVFPGLAHSISLSAPAVPIPGIRIPNFPGIDSTISSLAFTPNPNLVGFGDFFQPIPGASGTGSTTTATSTTTAIPTMTTTNQGALVFASISQMIARINARTGNQALQGTGTVAAPSVSTNSAVTTSNQNLMGFGPITQSIQGATGPQTVVPSIDPIPVVRPGLDAFYAALAASGYSSAIPPGFSTTG